MFQHRFICTDKERAVFRIHQMMANDLPCGKTLFGGNLYKAGIHFQVRNERIKGYYLNMHEIPSRRGSPIRVCFTGKFVEEAGNLFFDVYIYPRVIEVLFLLFAFVFLLYNGKLVGMITAVIFMTVFAKGYYDLLKAAYHSLDEIFG